MTSIKAEAAGVLMKAAADGRLTSGMVGIPVSITYDSAWDGLTKTVVFRAGELARSIRNAASEVTVPWEVMRKAGQILCVGVEGRNSDGTLVMPTVWAQIGIIERGANADVPAAGKPETGTGSEDDLWYYLPAVSQVDENTISFSYTPSKEEMPGIDAVEITLPAGKAGTTPVKGTDYFTESDKAEMVNAVLAALPTWEGGSY